MQTSVLNDGVTGIVRRQLGQELAAAVGHDVPEHRSLLDRWQTDELGARRLDADLQRDVLRALLLDSLVPATVDAQVRDEIVTLSGTVDSEWEREDAKHMVGRVPGVVGIVDHIARLPSPADEKTIREAVSAALARTAISDLADLTVEAPGSATVVLSGAVTSRSDHDLAIATAWSVGDVEAVDDCIQVE